MMQPKTKAEIRAFRKRYWTRETLDLVNFLSASDDLTKRIESILERHGGTLDADMKFHLSGLLWAIENGRNFVDSAVVNVSDEALAYIEANEPEGGEAATGA